jgi:hypothetical protein
MLPIAWNMLAHKPVRLVATWAGMGVLFFLAAAQLGLLTGWCNSCTQLIRHADADVWVMAERMDQARADEGVAAAVGMIIAWNTWQRPHGKRVNAQVVGLDTSAIGGPWAIAGGTPDAVFEPDGVILSAILMALTKPTMPGSCYANSILGRFDRHTAVFPDLTVDTLRDQGKPETLTFGQLARRACVIAVGSFTSHDRASGPFFCT